MSRISRLPPGRVLCCKIGIGLTWTQQCSTYSMSSSISQWLKPQQGFMKLSVDDAFHGLSNMTRFGWCVRDEMGSFVLAHSTSYHKLLPLLQALRWGIDLGLKKVIFEMDCKIVVDKVNSCGGNSSELGSILEECKELLATNYPFFSVVFARR